MDAFLIYELKVAVYMAAFCGLYRLLVADRVSAWLSRRVLLLSAVLSLLLPFCVITLHETVWLDAVPAADSVPSTTEDMLVVNAAALWKAWLLRLGACVLLAGTVARLLYIGFIYRQLRRIIVGSERHQLDDGVTLVVVDQPVAPFSWMRTVVLSRADYEECNPLIIAHERGHVQQHHSWDIVFVECLTALQWFNPVVWLMRRDLRTVHEYEADAVVLSSGSDASQYVELLMRKATGMQACALANGISNSILKKRTIMMLRKKPGRWQWIRAAYVVPLVVVSLAVSARTVTDYQLLDEKEHFKSLIAKSITLKERLQEKDEKKAVTVKGDFIELKENDDIKIVNPQFVKVGEGSDGKHPLVILNGSEVPYEQLEMTNPESIKSIHVLKNAESVKKYGEKGKNGVLLVEMKDYPGRSGNEPFKVHGKVVDEKQQPVIGATIVVRGTKKGSVTDMDGNFTIEALEGATIDAGYIGMESASFKVDRKNVASQDGTERAAVLVLKADRSDVAETGKEEHPNLKAETTGKRITILNAKAVVDGKEMTVEEMEEVLKPEQIESIHIDKSDPKNVKMTVTTKKN